MILANVDGFDKPGVMRSVPYTLGLSKTITTELLLNPNGGKGEFALDESFANALGWSGDGSVGTGSLKEFAIGAVVQHLTKSLARTPRVQISACQTMRNWMLYKPICLRWDEARI